MGLYEPIKKILQSGKDSVSLVERVIAGGTAGGILEIVKYRYRCCHSQSHRFDKGSIAG
jgi:hypothetical protein